MNENDLFRVRLEDRSMYTNECIRMLKNDLYRESEKNDSSRIKECIAQYLLLINYTNLVTEN